MKSITMTNFVQQSTLFWLSGSSLSWSYNSWIYNYLCNQCLSPL